MSNPVPAVPVSALPEGSGMRAFADGLRDRRGLEFGSYRELWEWSVADLDAFWAEVWTHFDVRAATPPTAVLAEERMPGARWFPGATLNYAEHVFRAASDTRDALVVVGEDGSAEPWSWTRLRDETAGFARFLKAHGVGPGDRVVGFLPNIGETITAFLAAASLGATWAVCNPDLAPKAVVDRLSPLDPTVLVAADGVRFAGKERDHRTAVGEIAAALPTLRATVVVPRLRGTVSGPGVVAWADAVAEPGALEFAQVTFDHPLWVLFSSGTTGAPKGIVHGHGGVLLELLKLLGLHFDVRTGDRFFTYTSTSWVLWNTVVSALLTGATAILYDGSPAHPAQDALWRIAAEQRATFLGTSAAYLTACARASLTPASAHDLSALRSVGSTGSALPEAVYPWVEQAVGVPVNSNSGGTDISSAFMCWTPGLPVRPGEIPAACLGVSLESWDEDGEPLVDELGELVITRPMPSMPVFFWNDPDGTRLHDAYFATYPGIWRHGDWITLTSRGTIVVHGRSDATLNRNGVRLGSAEIYAALDPLPEILDSLVVGVDRPDGSYWLPLFVHLAPGVELTDELRARILTRVRDHASARHVPDDVIAAPGIPHTLTGKRLEVPVRRILMGADPSSALDPAAIDDPGLLAYFTALA
ncbi:acetoacetate--CoA ligase [Actinocorallia sp. A-T 12471]|uniref:acetoacetate--CoA ligase n=1 Tax=Actinocorallia sp. A-T 12471 TaxID=3089813 RepID=UPI0029D3C86C|nr:acetoacetate--CoA ligase [Actinocorallia sp. A-T 12471]MDX6740038.1 acetoacetate--CoA ligase [Actinocorallia sp. A-T 12471]